jgi:hypothetical protein
VAAFGPVLRRLVSTPAPAPWQAPAAERELDPPRLASPQAEKRVALDVATWANCGNRERTPARDRDPALGEQLLRLELVQLHGSPYVGARSLMPVSDALEVKMPVIRLARGRECRLPGRLGWPPADAVGVMPVREICVVNRCGRHPWGPLGRHAADRAPDVPSSARFFRRCSARSGLYLADGGIDQLPGPFAGRPTLASRSGTHSYSRAISPTRASLSSASSSLPVVQARVCTRTPRRPGEEFQSTYI